jgi:hypothetical protein
VSEGKFCVDLPFAGRFQSFSGTDLITRSNRNNNNNNNNGTSFQSVSQAGIFIIMQGVRVQQQPLDEQGESIMNEATHRKRLAQILRYIANMHQTLNGDGVRHSFVRAEQGVAVVAAAGGGEGGGLGDEEDGDGDDDPDDPLPPPQRRRRAGAVGTTNRGGARQQQQGGGRPLLLPPPPPSDFFQVEDSGGAILFTSNDFSKLLALEQRASPSSSSVSPSASASAGTTTTKPTAVVSALFDRPLFSFYAAAAASSGGGPAAAATKEAAARKRTLAGALKSTFAAASSSFSSSSGGGGGGGDGVSSSSIGSSFNGKPCWLRITRLTNAQIMTGRPSLDDDHLHAAVRQYLEEWRRRRTSDNIEQVATTMVSFEDFLTLNRLSEAPPPSSTRLDARGASEIRGFLRRYKKYLLKREYQERLEPMYNRLFEWVQQRDQNHQHQSGSTGSSLEQPEELVFGLGHALWRQNDADNVSGKGGGSTAATTTTTWINGPVLEVLVEVELARDGALLIRPRDHTGVALNRQVVSALASGNGATAAAAGEDAFGDALGTMTSSFASAAPSIASSSAASAAAALAQLYRTVGELEASQLAPGQPSTYIPLLKRIAMELSSNGSYQPLSSTSSSTTTAASARTAVDCKLRITEAWCLYARPKPSSVFARDAMAFADMIATSSTGSNVSGPATSLPRAAWALTHGPGVFDSQSFSFLPNMGQHRVATSKAGRLLSWLMSNNRFATPASNSQPQEQVTTEKPLFPLPTSEPQNQIAELLLTKQAPAVVCEGPPGTGLSSIHVSLSRSMFSLLISILSLYHVFPLCS